MIAVWFARVMGIVVALLAVPGLFIEGEHMLGIMNVDVALDVVRIVLAVALLVVGFGRVSRGALNAVLVLFGASYLLLAVLGMIDAEVFGLLPTGLTGFDLAFHIIVGVAAIAVVFTPKTDGRDRSGRPATAGASASRTTR